MTSTQRSVSINYRSAIADSKGKEVLNFIEKHARLDANSGTILLDTSSHINLKSLHNFHGLFEETLDNVINLKRLNDVKFVNKFLEESNEVLSLWFLPLPEVGRDEYRLHP